MSDVEEMFAALRRQVDDVPYLRAGCDMLEARLKQRETVLRSLEGQNKRLREALEEITTYRCVCASGRRARAALEDS